MLQNILRRPQSFFDTRKSGEILNRCGGDTNAADERIPLYFDIMLSSLTTTFTGLLLIASLMPFILIGMVIVGFVVVFYLKRYLEAAVELKRLEQLSMTSILSSISELFNGAAILRSFGQNTWIMKKYEKSSKLNITTVLHQYICHIWIIYRLERSVTLLSGIAPFMIVMIRLGILDFSLAPTDNVIFGTILSYIFLVNAQAASFGYGFSEVAKNMSSIQRIVEYIDYDVQEARWDSPKAPAGWPSKGKIELKNVCLRYRPGLPLVINNLDFVIEPCSKVGIVGRTGSGKSTILLSLMRILEMDVDESTGKNIGSILIDGVDISTIGLHELRKNIEVIPQDPYLIEGSLRQNLDPFNLFSDEQIMKTIRSVQLVDTLQIQQQQRSEVSDGMRELLLQTREPTDKEVFDFHIEPAGQNLSLGQRQLICISRSLLTHPKILLMDEATASIDQKTDHIIQSIIKNGLSSTTVLTIAHRLTTIIQYDNVLILEKGSKKEEGSPASLIERRGFLFDLIKEGGEEQVQKMLKLANNRDLELN
jgi:ABC-type multidrug transport system fused ATPase/permease subunit